MATVFWIIIAFFVGLSFGLVVVSLIGANGRDEDNYPKYRHYTGKTYELITMALDEDRMEMMAVYRTTECKCSVYTCPKSEFFGKVKNYQGELVNRFTKINNSIV